MCNANPICPVCEDAHHLYTNMEFKLSGGVWQHTGYSDAVECTSCDTEFAEGDIDVPDLPGILPIDVIERAEAFIAGFEDDDEQEGVIELLRELRAALGREG